MKKLLITLLMSLPLLAGNLQLKEGFVAAHTEMLMDSTIDPLNTALQADISIQADDITSLSGKFWIEMNLFSSDNKDRDEHMHDATEVSKYPLATYTLSKVTKLRGDNEYKIEGTLNFFSQSKPFSTRSEITLEKGILTINATSMIKVSDYGLDMPCILFMCVRDEVDLFIKAVLVQ
ncbi:MAG: hypothetical protein COA44_14635 [Arcobacter sp.]|nr:MAG: hypothetical protein COA44_14635 [Arcobacter sp.]